MLCVLKGPAVQLVSKIAGQKVKVTLLEAVISYQTLLLCLAKQKTEFTLAEIHSLFDSHV